MTPQDQAIVLMGHHINTVLSLLVKTLEANGSSLRDNLRQFFGKPFGKQASRSRATGLPLFGCFASHA